MGNDILLSEIVGVRPRFCPRHCVSGRRYNRICLARDVIPAGFSIKADGGATFSVAVVAEDAGMAQPVDVIIFHGN